MEGARFDHETWKVADSLPGRMYDLLPAIYFKPAVNHKQAPYVNFCFPRGFNLKNSIKLLFGIIFQYIITIYGNGWTRK